MRRFVCNSWPELKLGNNIQFHRAVFETNDSGQIRIIEEHQWYNAHIFDGTEGPEPVPLPAPKVVQGTSSTADVEPKDNEDVDHTHPLYHVDQDTEQPPGKTDIARAPKRQLQDWCSDQNISYTDETTADDLRELLRTQLYPDSDNDE